MLATSQAEQEPAPQGAERTSASSRVDFASNCCPQGDASSAALTVRAIEEDARGTKLAVCHTPTRAHNDRGDPLLWNRCGIAFSMGTTPPRACPAGGPLAQA